eukprot:CAMPEP_0197716590 /NCGR_PEP_ID=MMETSP1434-20131217/1427_1 /TAXON_ID=265543 /ORGANISM="Minutocellus polymorphus, Strain CCMP3303" /LENGTH=202 /DNA_ID=CAMNT_0043300973 /DNA_START=87 /DNA_END=695 /DNA_ORIENTATION=-
MYSSISRSVTRSGARRVAAAANQRSVSNTAAAGRPRMPNSHATADVTAIPIPVSEILRQQAATQQARAKALAFILAGGAAGLAALSSSSAVPAMCEGDGSVSEEEMQHDWDDFMYKAIKPGEDDDDDDDDDEDDEDEDEEDEENDGDAGSEDVNEEEGGSEEESSDEEESKGSESEEEVAAPAADGEIGTDYKKKWKKAMFK